MDKKKKQATTRKTKTAKSPKLVDLKDKETSVSTKPKPPKVSEKEVIYFPKPVFSDIELTNTLVKMKGSKVSFYGRKNKLIAYADAETAAFKVSTRLLVKNTDVLMKLKELEDRIKILES